MNAIGLYSALLQRYLTESRLSIITAWLVLIGCGSDKDGRMARSGPGSRFSCFWRNRPCVKTPQLYSNIKIHTHTHTNINIFIYRWKLDIWINVFMRVGGREKPTFKLQRVLCCGCACVCVCVCVCKLSVCWSLERRASWDQQIKCSRK